MLRLPTLVVLITLPVACFAADLRTVEAVATGGPVVLDGALSEPCWQSGEWSTGFSFLDMPDKKPEHETRFKVRFDDSFLYIGAEMDEPDPAGLKADRTERDTNVWGDDCIEFMIDPTGERIEYYHIIVNPIGTIYDAQMRQGGNVRSVEWSCNMQAAASLGADKWFAEVRLPVVELGLTAASTGDWAINVTRARRGDGEELSTFSPLTGGFHQPSLYAALQLPGADFGKYLWEIKSPYEVRVLPDADGQLTYTAKTHVKNAGPRFRFIMLRGVLGDSPGEWVKDGLDAGQDREYEFSIPVANQGGQTLRLELVDRRKPDVHFAIKSLQEDITYSPITITMQRPWYRDSIYATENLEQLVFDVELALAEGKIEGASVLAVLTPTPADGTEDALVPLLARAEEAAKGELTMRLPLPALADGDYQLHVLLIPAGSTQADHAVTKVIHKLPQVAEEWRIDERNVLLHNGEPVLPFGWFSIPSERMAADDHAYQLMQSYSSYWFPVEKVRENLDRVVEAGTHVTIYPYQGPGMVSPSSVWGKPLTDEEAEGLRERVGALKDHPGVFAWYMADEPELRPALPERCRQLYETVRDEDPYRPTIMLNDTIAGIYKYVDGGDILMPDPYPCFIKGGGAAQPIEKTGAFMRACQEAGGGRKAIWITPQAFNYGDYGRKNQRGPTLTEMRNQLYQAAIYGAKGYLWYTYSHVSNYPELDIGMRWLSFEVADLKDAILENPAEDVQIKIDAPKPEHIHVSPRRVGDDLFIFAVNTATEPQDVTLSITPAPGLRSLYVVSEQRSIPLTDGAVITDTFDTYETHIYTTSNEVGSRESIAVPADQIAKANAARKKPGNLAFEDFSPTVEISSKSTYSSTPDRIFDGLTEGMMWRDGTPKKMPDWLVVRWPEAVTAKRFVVYTSTVSELEIQVPEDDGWATVASGQEAEGESITVTLDQPVTTDALRVLCTALRPEQDYTRITEVEVYAD